MIGWTEELISLLVNSTINYQEETTQKTIPGSNWSPRLCKTCKDKEPPIKPKLKKKKTPPLGMVVLEWKSGATTLNPLLPQWTFCPFICVYLLTCLPKKLRLLTCLPALPLRAYSHLNTSSLYFLAGEKKKNKELKGFISWWKIIPASLTGILSFPTQPPNELNGLLILSTCGRTC